MIELRWMIMSAYLTISVQMEITEILLPCLCDYCPLTGISWGKQATKR